MNKRMEHFWYGVGEGLGMVVVLTLLLLAAAILAHLYPKPQVLQCLVQAVS